MYGEFDASPINNEILGTTVLLLEGLSWSISLQDLKNPMITWVKLITVTVITVIPRWRTWNQARMFFVD
jgi:hypothetical protein